MAAPDLFETPLITYSLVDRGRKHMGQERAFKSCLDQTVKLINSGAVQERIQCRDMKGYLGHQFRANFGLTPPETVVLDGKAVALEAAFISTHIQAHKDGTVEHKAQFLTTPAGRLAQTYFENKTGGFSSAFDSDTKPRQFCGFDYVDDPNYAGNRGYPVALALDSAMQPAAQRGMLDSINEYNGRLLATLRLLDTCSSAYRQALDSVKRLEEENAELLSMLATGRQGEVILDSATKPFVLDQACLQQREADTQAFFGEKITPFAQDAAQARAAQRDDQRFIRQAFGFTVR